MKILRIGTRDSQLAVWQATTVQNLLKEKGVASELVFIKSEGDLDTVTPLYELGVQGIFTKSLDAALLAGRIDLAVHSMKDVPTQLAKGLKEAAVLERASYKDLFVYKGDLSDLSEELGFTDQRWHSPNSPFTIHHSRHSHFTIATSSIRRKAQWLNRYPQHEVENLRGNVNTRLRKLEESNWQGAIFAAAGLERINLRPENSLELDWMLPAPAQGAIMIACRENDEETYEATHQLNHPITALCTKIERDFLSGLKGGCSTPVSALAVMSYAQIVFKGNVCSTDGKETFDIAKTVDISEAESLGKKAAIDILEQPSALKIVQDIRNAKA
jgi:hydroxymethylbilane synthase